MQDQIQEDNGAQHAQQLSSARDEGVDGGELAQDRGLLTEWRERVRERPELWLGVAFVGGIVVAGVLRATSGEPARHAAGGAAGDRGSVRAQALEFWNNMQGALVGVASARIREYIDGMVPGFHEQYRHAEQRAAAGGSTPR